MSTFREKLDAAAARNESLVCVGLDPDPALMPIEDVAEFNAAIVEATADLVCCYKPNIAFYEALGIPGLEALRRTLERIPPDVPVICDAKRGDIGSTAAAYARALFEWWGFDAATVNPYLGRDSVEPFLTHADRGILILCHTSGPGSVDFQDLPVERDGERRPLFEEVALRASEWNTRGNAGLVLGATFPQQMEAARRLCPEMVILAPGIGAQGGDLESTVRGGIDAAGGGLIVNSSRGVLYASRDRAGFADAARQAADDLRRAVNAARG